MRLARRLNKPALYLTLGLCVIYFKYKAGDYFNAYAEPEDTENCFCELTDSLVSKWSCTVERMDYFNNMKMYPRLKLLLKKYFARSFKVNLQNDCPLSPEPNSECLIRFCHVRHGEDMLRSLKEKEKEVITPEDTKEDQQSNCSADDDPNRIICNMNIGIADQKYREIHHFARIAYFLGRLR